MPFQIIRNDITRVKADAIVNTASPRPMIGSGTDSAIYQAAGEKQLFAERRKIGDIARGEAACTPAFNLNAKYVIHTVGPIWIDGNHGEREILRSCYQKSMKLAADLSCESIAFPLIAAGNYGFPQEEALDIALAEISTFLLTHDMEITLVVFDRSVVKLSKDLVGDIDEYIDEHAVGMLKYREYGSKQIGVHKERRAAEEADFLSNDVSASNSSLSDHVFYESSPIIFSEMAMPCSAGSSGERKSLDEILKHREDTFQQRLFKLIDERHMTDPEVYHSANIDRKVFSKIRCNPNYQPKKKTAVAFAIALKLDMPTMRDLLSRAGFALSPGSKFDLIISYFIENEVYDIYEINAALFQYDQELLGY